jgi:hypothetical protein
MSSLKRTASYDDLSTERGFQFRFRCDACGSGFETRLQTVTSRRVPDLLHTAGGLFGAIWGHGGEGIQGIHHHGGQARDEAFAMAAAEARARFEHCTGCGRWVCSKLCWNPAAGLCKDCAQSHE